ncbi:MAG: AAA family ATPase [Bacteroidetes bacterium]|nr:AAA family ATPase [Bacteroidota bacterium]
MKLKLTKVRINKYKSFSKEQEINIDDKVTVLVGKNESGKTAFLESVAKINYFENNPFFKLNVIGDYPRNELIRFKNSGEDTEALRCDFELSKEMLQVIEYDLGKDVLQSRSFTYGISFMGKTHWFGLKVNERKFLDQFYQRFSISEDLQSQLRNIRNVTELMQLCDVKRNDTVLSQMADDLKTRIYSKAYSWSNPIKGYIAKHYLKPALPYFWYFDEYYLLPTRISIKDLKNPPKDDEKLRISKAFFDLAKIDIDKLLEADDFESYLADLEATANDVTNYIFKYWTTEKDLEIKFEIESIKETKDKILHIRIRNTTRRITLPLRNRSKGLNMFFSFVVWFSKVKNMVGDNLILLLDEPGLNLHAAAQADLLRFIEDLSIDHQVIYSTHSPFLINPAKLDRVRTVADTSEGSIVSDMVLENDPDTLFPLQAAIGFDISQNLFNNRKNLLVEDPTDLILLSLMSGALKAQSRTGLKEGITILPIGGLEKLATFLLLLKSARNSVVCLMPTGNNVKNKTKHDNEVFDQFTNGKSLRFYDQFVSVSQASIEDLFEPNEYALAIMSAYGAKVAESYKPIPEEGVLLNLPQILGREGFDRLRVAREIALLPNLNQNISENTFNRFEKLFREINKLL